MFNYGRLILHIAFVFLVLFIYLWASLLFNGRITFVQFVLNVSPWCLLFLIAVWKIDIED